MIQQTKRAIKLQPQRRQDYPALPEWPDWQGMLERVAAARAPAGVVVKESYKRNTKGLSNNMMYLKVNNNLYCLHAMNKYNEMECTVT